MLPAALSAKDVVFENSRMRLAVGEDAVVSSLVVKKTGQEMIAAGERLSLMSAEQMRPFHNEVKLVQPMKRVVYAANRLERDGNRLTVGFEGEPFTAEFRLKLTDDYLALEFVRFDFKRFLGGYDGLRFDAPPVLKLRALQLALRPRTYFGNWLNVVWDDANAAAVVACSPYSEIDHDEAPGAKVLWGALRRDMKMKGEPVALVVGAGKEDFLDALDALERDYGLPRGVRARRQKINNAPIFAADSILPKDLDKTLEAAKIGGFRLMKVGYAALVQESGTWGRCSDYDWRDEWTGGAKGAEGNAKAEANLRETLAKIRAAGIVPGLHFLQTHVGMMSRYVTPVADFRLNKRMRFTLAEPLPEGTNDIAEVRVFERTCSAPAYEPCRVLQFGGELLSYERASDEPPYRFFGVRRGVWKTRPQAHARGEIGGLLDLSEYGAPMSCYPDQNTDLPDEIADRIARLYNCGFGWVYMDGSEGVQAPSGINVALAQYRVWRKLKEAPVLGEGAAKSHFSWHMLSGANAFDGPAPDLLKEFLTKWQVRQAPLIAQDMSRCDFGWWSLHKPGECLWWMGAPETIGTQPDMWEFGEALSVSWGCPPSCSGLADWREHPNGADVLEVVRRWEDVRARGLLTPAQVEKFRHLRIGHEVTLLVGADGGYVFRDIEPLTVGDDAEGRYLRAFVFEEKGKAVVQFWCADKFERGLLLPADAPSFVWRDEYAGRELKAERRPEGLLLRATRRQYLFFDADVAAVRRLFARATRPDPVGVDVAAIRQRVNATADRCRRRFAELDRERTDPTRSDVQREKSRVAMLKLLSEERKALKELREYAKGEERAEIVRRIAHLVDLDRELCGW